MFWKRDGLVDELIEKNLARPIPGMEKPDLVRAARFVGRQQADWLQSEPRRDGAASQVNLDSRHE